jgi:oxygen-dependent protoporphyrinogen oxidase
MDGESIAKWGRRELGDEFVELMVYPFLGAYHGGLPETTSAAFYHALARVGLDVRLYAVAGGMARLTDAVVAALVAGGHRVQTGAAVDSVRVTDDVVSVLVAGDEARHDAVVLAVPSSQARTLAIDAPSFVSWLRSASSAPSITIAVATEGPVRAGWFGLAFPRMWSPGDRVVAACVQSAKVDGLVPANRGLIVAFPSPAIAAKLASDETDSIPSLIIPALEEAFGPLQRRVIRVKAYRHPEGHTQFPPGWIRHLQTFDEQWLPERMAIAGDYMVAPTVEGAVLSGERAANRLTAIFAPR